MDKHNRTKKVKGQHYVPSTYLDGWCMNNTPLYYYKNKKVSGGDIRNPDSILKINHLYTISHDQSYIMIDCPHILEEYKSMVKNKLIIRNVYGTYKGKRVEFGAEFGYAFLNLDDWEFYYKNTNEVASKIKIINDIKNYKSYLIEDGFSKTIENEWKYDYNDFLISLNFAKTKGKVRIINYEKVRKILRFAIITLMRNPLYDFLGFFNNSIYDLDFLFKPIIDKIDNEDRKKYLLFKKNINKCLILNDLYNALYSTGKRNFFETIERIYSNGKFKIVVYYANNSSFITSDNCSFINRNNVTIEPFNAMFIPLSYKYLLTVQSSDNSRLNEVECLGLCPNDVKKINKIIFNNAYKEFISNEKNIFINVW